MAFQTTTEVKDDYLKVVVTGEQTVEAVLDLLKSASASAEEAGQSRILVDYTGVTLGELSTRERLSIGMAMADAFGKRFKVAIVYPAPNINRFAEFTAVSEGARVLTVTTEEMGINWLLH